MQSVGERSRDLFEVRLVDRRRGNEVDVALSDVGFGISQILPFIVQSLAGEKQIITIEQPEVHIHPRLQADLGDLLAAAIQDPRNHRYIVETHSEHLVLRMQRLVREGNITPADVSVLYVSREPDADALLASAIQAPLDAAISATVQRFVKEDREPGIFHTRGFEARLRAFTIDPGFDAVGASGAIRRCLLKSDLVAEHHFADCRKLKDLP